MPKDILEKNKLREDKTLKRFETALKSSKILRSFFDKGFKSFDAFKAIMLNYYPEITEKKLWDFWHFRIIDEEVCDKIVDVFDKLKNE